MNKEIDFIRHHVSDVEILCQLAEECNELAHAALKLRRTIINENPTPVSEEEAKENFMEEIADVSLCLKALGMDLIDREFCLNITRTTNEKARRWAGRIRDNAK